eukprot:654475-Pelagomonas_calceolata.AAC.1
MDVPLFWKELTKVTDRKIWEVGAVDLFVVIWEKEKRRVADMKRKNDVGRVKSPTSIMEKEAHWLQRAVSSLHLKGFKQKVFMGAWRVTGSTGSRTWWI